MKGGHGQEPSDGRKNRPGKLNYIGRNKYKILTFVLAALVIANATGITGWIVDRRPNFPVVLWAGSGSSGGGSVCDGLNKGQCDSHGCCEWYGSKSSGECQFDCSDGTPYCDEGKEKCVECLNNSSDGKPNDCYKCVDGFWEKKANPFNHKCVECEDGNWVEKPGKETPCYKCVDATWKNPCKEDQYCDKIDQECKDCASNSEETEANGCGGEDTQFVPNDPCGSWGLGIVKKYCGIDEDEFPDSCDFESACDNHDECFGTTADECCNKFDECNEKFREDLEAACEANSNTGEELIGCEALVDCYVQKASSEDHYQPAQANVCCIDE